LPKKPVRKSLKTRSACASARQNLWAAAGSYAWMRRQEPGFQEDKPSWVPLRITTAPKIRQIYWCDFWKDARLPEMWKTRPVIIVSYKNTLHGPCLIIPTSTDPQDDNRWAHKLSIDIQHNGVQSWAICNQLSTISPSRLSQFNGKIHLLPIEDFNQVLDLVQIWVPKRFSLA
jgi:mRNA interferase MazF